jgi:hypothetical protein
MNYAVQPWADATTFWVQKNGSTPEEYEDASWVGPDGAPRGERAGRFLRLAVCDGASEAVLAGHWARHLAQRFGESRASVVKTLSTAVSEWQEIVEKYVSGREHDGSPIQWYEEPGLARGAFATLLMVQLTAALKGESKGSWQALALGDSCVFQVRDEQLIESFPIRDPDAFNSSPQLVPSRPADNDLVVSRIDRYRGRWESGDSFYLATDALAAWFLRHSSRGNEPWGVLRDLDTEAGPSSFEAWIASLRDAGEIHNDDVTLIRVHIW